MKNYLNQFQYVLCIVLLFPLCTLAQEYPYENEIREFEKMDKASPPPANPIVFTGSSSIRVWQDLPDYFPKKNVLNRGFGGSKLPEVLHFPDRVIVAYKPKQVVLYAGENDLAAGVSGQETYERFVKLFDYVRAKLPGVPFVFISIKPSPSRRKYFAEMDKANELIKNFLAKQRNADFVDIRPVMLTRTGQPIPELFRSDSLHMLPEGYKRWAPVLRPYLK